MINESVRYTVRQLIAERLELKDFGTYSKLVTKAYAAAPAMDPKAVPAWKALIAHVETLYQRIQSKAKVEFVDENPYPDAAAMKREVERTKVLKIWNGANQHPVWTPEQNLHFRAVHDWFSHIIANQAFGLKGEIAAYNTQAKLCPPNARPALFTEIVGQACSAVVNGDFPEQKIAFLPGFDYANLGRVEGHEIKAKTLVPKDQPQAQPQPANVPRGTTPVQQPDTLYNQPAR